MPDMLRWLWREYPKPIAGASTGAWCRPRYFRPAGPAAVSSFRLRRIPPVRVAPPLSKALRRAARRSCGPAGRTARRDPHPDLHENGWEQVRQRIYSRPRVPAVDKYGNVFFADPVPRIASTNPTRAQRDGLQGKHGRREGAARRRGRTYLRESARETAHRVVRPCLAMRRPSQAMSSPTISWSTPRGRFISSTPRARPSGTSMQKGSSAWCTPRGEIMQPVCPVASRPIRHSCWVADGMNRYTWSFQIAPDGSLINGEPFQRLETA